LEAKLETADAKVVEVFAALRLNKAVLCSAESCTGGLIASRITAIPGSSDVFWGAVVVYDNRAKMELAGVSSELLAKYGAVSEEVARSLADGILARARSSYSGKPPRIIAVSTTGIAGPGGGSAEKPVGLCWIGLADSESAHRSAFKCQISATLSRGEIQRRFSEEAFQYVLDKGFGRI
jgi:PncC family amidohydrolase